MTHWAAELPSQWLDGATCTSVVCSRPVARVDTQTPTVRATRTIMPQWVFWDAVAMAAALELLDAVRHAGVEFSDPRISFVTVQIDADIWDDLQALPVRQP